MLGTALPDTQFTSYTNTHLPGPTGPSGLPHWTGLPRTTRPFTLHPHTTAALPLPVPPPNLGTCQTSPSYLLGSSFWPIPVHPGGHTPPLPSLSLSALPSSRAHPNKPPTPPTAAPPTHSTDPGGSSYTHALSSQSAPNPLHHNHFTTAAAAAAHLQPFHHPLPCPTYPPSHLSLDHDIQSCSSLPCPSPSMTGSRNPGQPHLNGELWLPHNPPRPPSNLPHSTPCSIKQTSMRSYPSTALLLGNSLPHRPLASRPFPP